MGSSHLLLQKVHSSSQSPDVFRKLCQRFPHILILCLYGCNFCLQLLVLHLLGDFVDHFYLLMGLLGDLLDDATLPSCINTLVLRLLVPNFCRRAFPFYVLSPPLLATFLFVKASLGIVKFPFVEPDALLVTRNLWLCFCLDCRRVFFFLFVCFFSY